MHNNEPVSTLTPKKKAINRRLARLPIGIDTCMRHPLVLRIETKHGSRYTLEQPLVSETSVSPASSVLVRVSIGPHCHPAREMGL